MKRFLFVIFLALGSFPHLIAAQHTPTVAPGSPFVSEYLSWKTRFAMSAFTLKEDYAINVRAQSGSCVAHVFFLAEIGTWHMPKASLSDKETMDRYYKNIERFHDICLARE